MVDFPNLKDDQHAVLCAEVCTGIVLGLDRARLTGSGEVWRVFECLSEARDFAAAEIVTHPESECCIYDSKRQMVQVLRNERRVAELGATSKPKRRVPWWQFWETSR